MSANLSTLLLKPSLAENLAKEQRQADLSADLNRNLAGVAAGFGTAQQQASKQAALSGMPGSSDQVGMWQKIQEAQQTQTAQDEHARFMGNAGVFAQIIGKPIDQATEIMNGGAETMKPFLENLTTPDSLKLVNAWEQTARASGMSDKEIQDNKSIMLGGLASGGQDPALKDMNHDRMVWQAANPGQAVPSYLTNVEEYKLNVVAKTGKEKDLIADQHNFAPALTNYDKTISALDEFMKPDMQEAAKEFLGTTGQYNPVANMTDKGKKAWSLYKQIMGSQFSSGVQDFKGAGRITQQELNQDLPSQSTMGQLNQTPEDFATATQTYRDQLARRRAGLFGAAQLGNDPRLSDEDYAKYVAPNLDIAGGPRRANDFSNLSDDAALAKISSLPSGKKFIGPDGQVHTRK